MFLNFCIQGWTTAGDEEYEFDYFRFKDEEAGTETFTEHKSRALAHFGMPEHLCCHDVHAKKTYYK